MVTPPRSSTDRPPRLIVGISGASGAVYGVRLLDLLQPLPVETHLVMSRTAEVTLAYETDFKVAEVKRKADVVHKIDDLGASLSSGSYPTLGMIVAPCSTIRTGVVMRRRMGSQVLACS